MQVSECLTQQSESSDRCDPSQTRVTGFTSLRTTRRIPPMWREGAVDQGHCCKLSKERDDCYSQSSPTTTHPDRNPCALRRGGSIRPHINSTVTPTQSIPPMWLNADSPPKTSSLGRSGSIKSTMSSARKPYHRLLDATKRCSLHLPVIGLTTKAGNCSSLALPWLSSRHQSSTKM